MSAYDDLIPGSARRQSAYADLLPARTPAPDVLPAQASPAVASAPTPGTGGSPMPQPLSLARRMASIRRHLSAIQWDRNKSPEEKRDEMNLYNQRMKDLAAKTMRLYQSRDKSYSPQK